MAEPAQSLSDSRIGPYQIVGKVGAGGMGVVFKAIDVRLQRTVALKFLPADRDIVAVDKDRLLREAADIGVKPTIGIRVRLAHTGRGKWEHTGGEKSKFGLSPGQILEAVNRLRSAGMLNSPALLHFHLGSQIAIIRDIQRFMLEELLCFAELS